MLLLPLRLSMCHLIQSNTLPHSMQGQPHCQCPSTLLLLLLLFHYRGLLRARKRAASADVAAVRLAVSSPPSISASTAPVRPSISR